MKSPTGVPEDKKRERGRRDSLILPFLGGLVLAGLSILLVALPRAVKDLRSERALERSVRYDQQTTSCVRVALLPMDSVAQLITPNSRIAGAIPLFAIPKPPSAASDASDRFLCGFQLADAPSDRTERIRAHLEFLASIAWPLVLLLTILAFGRQLRFVLAALAAKMKDLKTAEVPGRLEFHHPAERVDAWEPDKLNEKVEYL